MRRHTSGVDDVHCGPRRWPGDEPPRVVRGVRREDVEARLRERGSAALRPLEQLAGEALRVRTRCSEVTTSLACGASAGRHLPERPARGGGWTPPRRALGAAHGA